MRLDQYSKQEFDRGASRFKEALWIILSGLFVSSWLPGSYWRCLLLSAFGARIGREVVIKPGVEIKYPWRLYIGSYCWIGEGVKIDNLDWVNIEDHVCISQGAYLCTGNHDWNTISFDLRTSPITLRKSSWMCAFSRLAPGSELCEGAVLSIGSTGIGNLDAWTVYAGCPATPRHKRQLTGLGQPEL